MTLHIRNVSKTYSNGVQALKDVALTIPAGMYGLLRSQRFGEVHVNAHHRDPAGAGQGLDPAGRARRVAPHHLLIDLKTDDNTQKIKGQS
jgi:hypothetical protein